MKILKKLTIKNLVHNKKRSIGTIIGIILSVALICAVGGMFSSLRGTLVQGAIDEHGYNHFNVKHIDEEKFEEIKLHKNVEKVDTIYELGVARFPNKVEDIYPYIKVLSIDRNTFDDLSYELKNGRFPIKDDEIIVNEKTLDKSGLSIGDTITLNVGRRTLEDGSPLTDNNPVQSGLEVITGSIEKSYKIVGAVNNDNQNYFFAFTVLAKSKDIYAYATLSKPKDYEKTITEIMGTTTQGVNAKGEDLTINGELLRWEVFAFSDSTISTLMSIAGVVILIIMVTSIFCIRNSFAISTMEKTKMYGMLSSIGATKKQIKRSVILEGMFLGVIGIPIGILSGIFADFVLIKVVNALLGDTLFDEQLIFSISWVPIVVATVLGILVIYLSSIVSAIKASKVSPIENLRNSSDIKMNQKHFKAPKIIKAIFKTGGVLAYKNLKRSKKKYRTTVVSLTVSILVFISMNAFINEGFKSSMDYYTDFDYNLVAKENDDEITKEDIKALRELDKVKNVYINYEVVESLNIKDFSKAVFFDDENRSKEDYKDGINMSIRVLDDMTFMSYSKKLGIDYEKVKDKGILYDLVRYYTSDDEVKENRRYSYKKGDIIEGTIYDDERPFEVEIGAVAKEGAYGLESTFYDGGYLILNEKYFSSFNKARPEIYIDAEKASVVENEISKLGDKYTVENIEDMVNYQRSFILVVSIFLYGFITVITLIGVTNIFNTITSNMELRSREFAIFKSIGMTKREFNRMINLETILYSMKSLVFGIVLGIGGAYLVHIAFNGSVERGFEIPYTAIAISIVAVFIIVYLIMKYSIKKISKQNTIETIRSENI